MSGGVAVFIRHETEVLPARSSEYAVTPPVDGSDTVSVSSIRTPDGMHESIVFAGPSTALIRRSVGPIENADMLRELGYEVGA